MDDLHCWSKEKERKEWKIPILHFAILYQGAVSKEMLFQFTLQYQHEREAKTETTLLRYKIPRKTPTISY